MWLDCILLFPVIMLGLERLVREEKGLLYCVALGAFHSVQLLHFHHDLPVSWCFISSLFWILERGGSGTRIR